MASLSADQIAARRTFANVAASASAPTKVMASPQPAPDSIESSGPSPPSNQPVRNEVIIPAIPRQLSHNLSNDAPQIPATNGLVSPPALTTQVMSGTSDESTTQVSSSGDSAKPASLDGKSVASVTTFAMDEKESLRPDDSASVKANDDDDVFSPLASGQTASRLDLDIGALAFRHQLQEITSHGPALRQSRPASRPDPTVSAQPGVLYVPPPVEGSSSVPGYVPPPSAVTGRPEDFLPDPKLLEALGSPRDRIWVLKLEQDIIDFVKDSKEHAIDLPQCNSFYRMLAHKLADYYSLGHAVDGSVPAVRLFKTPTCRIAPPLSAFATTPTETGTPPPTAPQMKILRRGGDAPLNGLSKPGSESGDGADSDKNKAPLTREQREQRYEEARLRILGSAKPVEDPSIVPERDDSRSSSATGKKKPKKQRNNSNDDFEARSAYSTFNTTQGAQAESGPQMYYPAFPGANTPGMYAPQNQSPYNAVYGSMAPSQAASYPWLQHGYSGYNDPNSQQQPNGNDLAADFQAMSFQGQTGPTPPPQAGPYGYHQGQQQQQQQQQHAAWSQNMQYQANYAGSAGYAGQFVSRPASSASHGSVGQGYPYGGPPNQMHMSEHYMNYPGAFNRGAFNPQSQSFVPNYQPQYGAGMAGYNNPAYNAPFQGAPALQRQNSSQSQASSYSGQRGNVESSRPMHPLPQPVFSPHVTMPFHNSQRQGSAPARANGNMAVENGQSNGAPSTIAKWGTPASLPAKPPPPAAGDSFDMSRVSQNQRNAPAAFNQNGAGRMAGVGGQGFHNMPPMVALRGGRNGQ